MMMVVVVVAMVVQLRSTTTTTTTISAFMMPTPSFSASMLLASSPSSRVHHHPYGAFDRLLFSRDHHRHDIFLWSSSLNNNNDDTNNNDDDGAELAAAFFRTAQSKGINIDSNDLLDDDEDDEEEDDEEDDDDDDDEVEPNIPQGAINAFLGYDTGNVGEKLAGNVTLTNDQLYSEVKERVLESAGGFVSLVRGANDDDDDDEDDEDDEDRILISGTNKPYIVPTIVPDSELTAGEVVLLVLEALRNNDTPVTNKGVEILFGYSSPGSQIKNEVGLTPNEYADFLKETEYKILFTNGGPIHIDKADYSFDGKKAFFTARLPTSVNAPLDTVSVNFILSTTGREDDACWLIDSILIRPQSMRRRRRK